MDQTLQEKLIGVHPVGRGTIAKWLKCEDVVCEDTKRHRALLENDSNSHEVISEIVDWIVKHHLTERKKSELERKKQFDASINVWTQKVRYNNNI